MNTLIAYYSRSGSNQYLAEKLAERLNADLEPIRPIIDQFGCLLAGSWLKLGPGIKPFQYDVQNYGRVILVSPIWAGQLIAPLRAFIKKYHKDINELYIVTCCGSTDEIKDTKFGYETVFKKAQKIAGEKLKGTQAFPIALALPLEKRDNDEEIMNTRLTDANFKDELKERFELFINKLL